MAAEDFTPAWRPVLCRVSPERVVDYPGDGDVAEATGGQFANAEDAHPEVVDYAASLGAVGGWKVGGHPQWVRDPKHPTCRRYGRRMGLFLQADS